jgi:short-subunit dehydrogenase
VQIFAPGMAERDDGHIVNIAATEMFGTRCAAVDAAITHAIVGLSESLYRELDSMGSRVGVTLVCPALGNTNIASAPECRNSLPPATRYVPLHCLPPAEVAEQIFAAVVARCFWFCTHTPSRASRARTDSTAKSQIQRPRKRAGAARKAEGYCRLGVARQGAHLRKSQ